MDTKKLRQKILDLAIRGKLVPQDPNDEPASVLLERIRAEKERLIKEGKIKRSKKSTSDTPHYKNEAPFEVPESWEWTTIGEIASSILYGVSESAKEKGRYKLLRITDIQNNKVNWETVPFTDYDNNKAQAYLLNDGDILFARTGATVGKSYLVEGLKDSAIYASYLIRVQTSSVILPSYIKFFLESGFYWEQISLNSVGIGQPNVNGTTLAALTIPIPPYREQLRIVEETKKWLAVIDGLDVEIDNLQTYITQAKSKILDLAIHGKLVPQDPNDEPAIELLKRKNPKFTPCDNAHYENVPSNWVVCKVKDVFRINPKTKADDGMEAGFVPMSNIQDSYNNNFSYELRTWGNIKKGYTHFENGDIVVAKISPCLENRKSAIMVGLPNGIGAGTTELNVFRSDYVHPLYGLFFFKSDYFISQCIGTFNGVVGQQRVSTKTIEDIALPVPPRSEQERIINKVNELFLILDNISAEL